MEPTINPESELVGPSNPEADASDTKLEASEVPSSQERVAPRGDRPSASEPPVQPIQLPQPVAPDPVMPKQDDSLNAQVSSDFPIIADDVDVIEKEWVEKAKNIVNEHKHDPYVQEDKASKLQADYLKKRYGKTVKTAE